MDFLSKQDYERLTAIKVSALKKLIEIQNMPIYWPFHVTAMQENFISKCRRSTLIMCNIVKFTWNLNVTRNKGSSACMCFRSSVFFAKRSVKQEYNSHYMYINLFHIYIRKQHLAFNSIVHVGCCLNARTILSSKASVNQMDPSGRGWTQWANLTAEYNMELSYQHQWWDNSQYLLNNPHTVFPRYNMCHFFQVW